MMTHLFPCIRQSYLLKSYFFLYRYFQPYVVHPHLAPVDESNSDNHQEEARDAVHEPDVNQLQVSCLRDGGTHLQVWT